MESASMGPAMGPYDGSLTSTRLMNSLKNSGASPVKTEEPSSLNGLLLKYLPLWYRLTPAPCTTLESRVLSRVSPTALHLCYRRNIESNPATYYLASEGGASVLPALS
ncbi:unnamed protein product [Clonostachys byssicola]|uniref:Uncharacterized protein n=1 Tax=Clonostachys byssicola TaxID=160290 RepID=A0A9N9YCH4_9HYPO|nr:unnamed protein product [Clonostachys byssicola]